MSLGLFAGPAHAAVTFEYLFDDVAVHDCSDNGQVLVGLSFATSSAHRWTQATGLVDLGRPMTYGKAGVAAISADGSRVAFTIGSLDGSYTTQGRWSQATGWQELFPPLIPSGGNIDGSYGSVWGMSGDGGTVVGLYWRAGNGNRAHASGWTQASGPWDLGGMLTGQSGRANGVNYNGSVVGGWVETPQGPWRPAVWDNGSLELLTDWQLGGIAGSGEVKAVSPDGNIAVGYCINGDGLDRQRAAAMWKRVDGVWGPTQFLGWVDASEPQYGITIANCVSADGRIAAGYASTDGSPFTATAFVWTPATGVVDVHGWLADNGVFMDPNFAIQGIQAMTPDGQQIFGTGRMLTPPYTTKSFRITVPATLDAPAPQRVSHLELSAPRPNPSRGGAALQLALATESNVDLAVFDASGRRVTTLLSGRVPAGQRSVTWDGRESSGRTAPAGLYFARVVTEHGTASQRIVRVN
jgi:uncharacterized membrane protein